MFIKLMKRKHKVAFEEVDNAALELRSKAKKFETSLKNELDIIGNNVDKTFEDKYLELKNKLNSIYKLLRIKADLEDPDPE